MARKCDICGKGRTLGKSRAHKYGGKWAMRAQEKPRLWNPNLQAYTVDGKKMRLCTRCIKRIKFDKRKKAEVKKIVIVKPETQKVVGKAKKPVKKVAKNFSKKASKKE